MARAEIRAVVADDEPLARRGVREYSSGIADLRIVGEARDGLEAVRLVAELRPDLLFLDVQMPELDGFEVLEALPQGTAPAVVFITAHETYALRAFDAHAVDYLLKPCDRARFLRSLEKARVWIGRGPDTGDPAVESVLADVRAGRARQRFCVKHGDHLRVVPADGVDWIEARGNYVYLHTRDGEHLLRASLADLARQLDPAAFVRVHRSTIVRVAAAKELERLPGGDYRLRLHSGAELTVSRTHWPALTRAIEGAGGGPR